MVCCRATLICLFFPWMCCRISTVSSFPFSLKTGFSVVLNYLRSLQLPEGSPGSSIKSSLNCFLPGLHHPGTTEVWDAILPTCFLQALDEEALCFATALFDVCKAMSVWTEIQVTEVTASGAHRGRAGMVQKSLILSLSKRRGILQLSPLLFLAWMMTQLLMPVKLLGQHCKYFPLPIQKPFSQLFLVSLAYKSYSSYICLGQWVLQLQTLLLVLAVLLIFFHSSFLSGLFQLLNPQSYFSYTPKFSLKHCLPSPTHLQVACLLIAEPIGNLCPENRACLTQTFPFSLLSVLCAPTPPLCPGSSFLSEHLVHFSSEKPNICDEWKLAVCLLSFIPLDLFQVLKHHSVGFN